MFDFFCLHSWILTLLISMKALLATSRLYILVWFRYNYIWWIYLFNGDLNPLTTKSDWHLVSPYGNTSQSSIKVVRQKRSESLKVLILEQILLTSPYQYHRKFIGNMGVIYMLILGFKGLSNDRCNYSVKVANNKSEFMFFLCGYYL